MSLPDFEMSYKHFLDKSAIIYGETKSGKSFFINDILYHLSEHIDQIIVFSPTDKQNKNYEAIVPLPCIHYTISPEILLNISERQKAMSSVYKNTHDMNVIKSLFFKIPDIDDAKLIVHKIIEKEKQHKQELADRDDAKEKMEGIQKAANQAIETIYKQYINANRAVLASMKLTNDEQQTLKYLNMNPRMVIVFDDCTEVLKDIKKNKIMQQFFFAGRHDYITFIIACHTDKCLDGELRGAAFVSVWTSRKSASSYIERPTNSLTKEDRRLAYQLSDLAFSQKYQKLLWVRDEGQYYKYTAEPHEEGFKFGSEHLWDYCKAIENDGKIIKNNRYINLF